MRVGTPITDKIIHNKTLFFITFFFILHDPLLVYLLKKTTKTIKTTLNSVIEWPNVLQPKCWLQPALCCYKVKHHSVNRPLIALALEVGHCLQKSWLTFALLLYCFSIDFHRQDFLSQGKKVHKTFVCLNPHPILYTPEFTAPLFKGLGFKSHLSIWMSVDDPGMIWVLC